MNKPVRIDLPSEARFGFTADEFMRMIAADAFDGGKAELVGGEIRKLAPAGVEHGESNARVMVTLYEAFRDTDARIAVDLAIANDRHTVRGADVAVMRASAPRHGAIEGSDAILLVEIADTTLAKDLGEKAAEYAAAGVPVLWVVDVNARAVHVLAAPGADGYGERAVYRFGEAIPVPGTDRTVTLD